MMFDEVANEWLYEYKKAITKESTFEAVGGYRAAPYHTLFRKQTDHADPARRG
ncbi:hypothetical protein ABNC35_05895 [Paenibacillus larvae]|uniref:hypothetical protein n=1 Tax=Paenibacillus larvae TaxID=1464 RepID=UPI001F423611|nr:hypothetical protein [Paenibacillus larvae]MCY7488857.1 hypothetical protein [Paenibacillus larvae]MCY9570393.1 hypothetical protein [Paenibacillus larvae]MCY9717851.1 hypothetical protein [Paenibacillus larvae]MDE5125912.1 hypothetical protein [Paenibacillus larvae subsp. larvae]MDE5149300.1 hypothetical protein [Paenibacillus larvae subsp. larvae]